MALSGIVSSFKGALPSTVKLKLGSIKRKASILACFYYDARTYMRWSIGRFDTRVANRQNMRALITLRSHGIEKGLSLPVPRARFGEIRIGELIDYMRIYIKAHGEDVTIDNGVAVLKAYRDFNIKHNAPDYPHKAAIDEMIAARPVSIPAGTLKLTRAMVLKATQDVSPDFFQRRHSTRHFSDQPVTNEEIRFAAQAAIRAPAVCNRQFGKILVTRQRHEIKHWLDIQGGAKGFDDQPRAVAAIAMDIRNFWDVSERYQPWIDGGLFAMSFILGLHARGLGTCCLNWSKKPEDDARMLAALKLPPYYRIIMLIAIGHLPEKYEVGASYRVPVDELLQLN